MRGISRRSLLIGLAAGGGPPPVPPDLFFYPPPYMLENGGVMPGPIALSPFQVAEGFPEIAEMTGVSLLIYWSHVNPEPGRYDWSLLDHALQFWKQRGRRIVVGLATVGNPILRYSNGKALLQGATPDWVLRRVAIYNMAATVIKPVRPNIPIRQLETTLPVYWDKEFLRAVTELVQQLARYDGNETISKIRISTGIVGEDNPSFDGLKSAIPGFSNEAWISYCRQITQAYLGAFHRTQLEFDIDRLGWISALGTVVDQAAAASFVRYLDHAGIYCAMNGLDSAHLMEWRAGATTGAAKSLNYIAGLRRSGRQVGLEGAPLSNPNWQDVATVAAAFKQIGANRLIMFGDLPGLVNYLRYGTNPANQWVTALFDKVTIGRLTEHAMHLLRDLGFGN